MTSDVLARAMRTNPVVVRRVLGGLREQGYVRSEKGHGGGWTLARELSRVTLRDVYVAIGRPALLAVGHRTERPRCRVEQVVNASLDRAFEAAETLLLERLGELTLSALQADFRHRLAMHGGPHHLAGAHAN